MKSFVLPQKDFEFTMDMIEEIPITKLDQRQIKQLERLQTKLALRIQIILPRFTQLLLNNSPGCLELRKKLRELQLRTGAKEGSTKGLTGLLGRGNSRSFHGLEGKSDKDPEGSLKKAEDLISQSPGNVLAHQMLADASFSTWNDGHHGFCLRNHSKNSSQKMLKNKI